MIFCSYWLTWNVHKDSGGENKQSTSQLIIYSFKNQRNTDLQKDLKKLKFN